MDRRGRTGAMVIAIDPKGDLGNIMLTFPDLDGASFRPWVNPQAAGGPRLSVVSIAHLNDSERMFFVTMLLNEIISWMRRQPGTGRRCGDPLPRRTPVMILSENRRQSGILRRLEKSGARRSIARTLHK